MRPTEQEKRTIWEDLENFSERIRAPRPLLEAKQRSQEKTDRRKVVQRGVVMKRPGTRRAALTRVVPAQRRAGYQQE